MKRSEVGLEGQKYPRNGVEREFGWCMRVEVATTEPSNGRIWRGNLLRIGRESIEALVKGTMGLGQTRRIHCT